ncbi:MAG: preprotein translocase subunit Sec61beta [Nanoarchaeota archaeon]|nr:preprotein translocase subunit Sec61beta [Nanoarchaeota archaeon]
MAEMSMPGSSYGGLVRYNEEYPSKLKFKAPHVIIMVALVILFVLALNIFFPVK